MSKKSWFVLCILLLNRVEGFTNDVGNSLQLFKQGTWLYREHRMPEAKERFLTLLKRYPDSPSVPHALLMLSYVEPDQVLVREYLIRIRNEFPNFSYWVEALERLGDLYYASGLETQALDAYNAANTDKAFYMRALIYAQLEHWPESLREAKYLIRYSKDKSLVYKAFLLYARAFLHTKQYDVALRGLQASLEYLPWAYDDGSRVLLYTGLAFYGQNDLQSALRAFLHVVERFPLSADSKRAARYIDTLREQSIVESKPIAWLDPYFTAKPQVAYGDKAGVPPERQAMRVGDLETAKSVRDYGMNVVETVLSLGKFKDLSVANLLLQDVHSKWKSAPFGVFLRDSYFHVEMRTKDPALAQIYADKMLDLGFKDLRISQVFDSQVPSFGSESPADPATNGSRK